MAVIKFSPIVTAASGKSGGTVFSRNRGGSYIRAWKKPLNPNSTAQQNVRNRLVIIGAAWRNLSDAVRKNWKSLADSLPMKNKMGESMTLSGQQLFSKRNGIILAANGSVITDAPTASAAAPVFMDVQDFTSTDIIVALLTDPLPANVIVVFFATAPLSPGISSISASAYRQVQVSLPLATGYPLETAAYVAVFGSIANSSGKKVSLMAKTVDILTGEILNVDIHTAILT